MMLMTIAAIKVNIKFCPVRLKRISLNLTPIPVKTTTPPIIPIVAQIMAISTAASPPPFRIFFRSPQLILVFFRITARSKAAIIEKNPALVGPMCSNINK